MTNAIADILRGHSAPEPLIKDLAQFFEDNLHDFNAESFTRRALGPDERNDPSGPEDLNDLWVNEHRRGA